MGLALSGLSGLSGINAGGTLVQYSFEIAAAANDGQTLKAALVYPPTGSVTVNTGSTGLGALRNFRAADSNYLIGNLILIWDTSSIPDTATIQSAVLRVKTGTTATSADNRNLTAEWYNAGASIDTSDYTETSASDAGSFPISGFATSTQYDLTLASVTGISKTGNTSMRLHVDGGIPTGTNQVNFNNYGSSSPYPTLIVTALLP